MVDVNLKTKVAFKWAKIPGQNGMLVSVSVCVCNSIYYTIS